MTRARDTSRVVLGVGTAVNGDNAFIYVDKGAKTIIENLVIDSTIAGSSNSYVVLNRKQMVIQSGIGVTIGTGKQLIINPNSLPDSLT
jgi:hypothetical protein